MIDLTRHVQQSNAPIAKALREVAALLAAQDASGFRVQAYQRAAAAIEALDTDIATVAQSGPAALEALPGIGRSIAGAIQEMTQTGKWSLLDRLRGTSDPEIAFRLVPGIGPVLAHKLHAHLHIDTLEALEAAAHDGRLAAVPGIGPRRVTAIRNALASMLTRGRRAARSHSPAGGPSVSVLLDVDREYRIRAAKGGLALIAPKRFNPESKAWLPILHTERDEWHFTALYSNSARAHELGKTADWVVIFHSSDAHPEDQCTVVTETAPPLNAFRVVRGRETECLAFYQGEGHVIIS